MPSDTQNRAQKPPRGTRFSTIIVAVFFGVVLIVSTAIWLTSYLIARQAIEKDFENLVQSNSVITNLVFEARLASIQQDLSVLILDETLVSSAQKKDGKALRDQLATFLYGQNYGRIDFLFVRLAGAKDLVGIGAPGYDIEQIRAAALNRSILDANNQVFKTEFSGTPIYSIINRQEIIAPTSGRVLGHLFAGVILNDNIDIVRDVLNSTKGSAVGLYHGGRLIVAYPLANWEELGLAKRSLNRLSSLDQARNSIYDVKLSLDDLDGKSFHMVSVHPPGAIERLEKNSQVALFLLAIGILFVVGVATVMLRQVSHKATQSLANYANNLGLNNGTVVFEGSSILEFNQIGRVLEHFVNTLRDTEEKFRQLTENSHDVFWLGSLDWKEVHYISPTYEKIWGISCQDLYDDPMIWFHAIHLDDRKMVGEDLEQKINGDLSNPSFPDYRIVRPDGDVRWVRARAFVIYDADGKPWRIAGNVEDITKRKHVEAQLHQAYESLEDEVAQRTQELELALKAEQDFNALQKQFLSMASHELRNPLSIIDLTAQLLDQHLDRMTPEDIKTRVSKISRATKRITNLIESTLNATKTEEGKLGSKHIPCDLAAIIRECIENQNDISQNHDFVTELEDLPAKIIADPGHLSQIFTNLLTNAIKYSPDHPQINVRGHKQDNWAVISVVDQGIGISKEDMPSMFKRFFRTSNAAGIPGTGIGLNLTKQLVELQGGEIKVESVDGEGTTFSVYFPIKRAEHLSS